MHVQEKVYIPLGLYIHIPFCAIPCDYCAFYKEIANKQNFDIYFQAFEQEISAIQDSRSFDTIYIGGGTPGILLPHYISKITDAIYKKLNKDPIECTVEISPNTVSLEKLLHWRDIANRISIGVQSFLSETLKSLGRKQTPEQIFSAYNLVRKVGFDNVGIDLIFSAPGQTKSQLLDDLRRAVDLEPEHISTYCLTYENNTKLISNYGNNSNENFDGSLYEIVCDFLENHGYMQYEISNFSKPGFQSIHNKNTWHMHEWIGIGPSASSQYNNMRYTNISSLAKWAKNITKNPKVDVVHLNDKIISIDKIIFGLRMNQGVELSGNKFAETVLQFAKTLEINNLAIVENRNIKLTSKGRLLCDAISQEIFNLLD